MRTHLLLGALALSSASLDCGCSNRCADVDAIPTTEATPRVLAIGDSILAWNADRCQSIPHHAGLVAKAAVTNVAVSGARVLSGDEERPAIPKQYESATADDTKWDVVLVDGGGNDLNGGCACGGCEQTLNSLVSSDGKSGAMAELLAQIVDDGARVVLIDYFELHQDAWYGFDRCGAELAELEARYQTLAREQASVTFIDLGTTVTPESHPEAYTFDNVHPSDEGSALLGAVVAKALQEQEK